MFPPPTLGKNQVELIDIHTRDIDVQIMNANPTYGVHVDLLIYCDLTCLDSDRLCPVLNEYKIKAESSDVYQRHYQNVTTPLLCQLSSLLKTNLSLCSCGLCLSFTGF